MCLTGDVNNISRRGGGGKNKISKCETLSSTFFIKNSHFQLQITM